MHRTRVRRVTIGAIAASLVYGLAGAAPASAGGDDASAPAVVVSIRPLYSLTAAVMDGIAVPRLLLTDAPEADAELAPGQRTAIEQADVVIWVGPQLERRIERVMVASGRDLISLSMIDAAGVRLMEMGGGNAPRRPHSDRAERPHLEDRERQVQRERQVSTQEVTPERPDPLIWLSPRNGVAMVRAIAAALEAADPANSARYQRNALTTTIALEALDSEVEATVAPSRGGRYATVGPGFQYFERNYVLNPLIRLDFDSAADPGAEAIAAGRQSIIEERVACVLQPASFDPSLGGRLVHRTQARLEIVDPYGRGFDPGPENYFELIRQVASEYAECLAPSVN